MEHLLKLFHGRLAAQLVDDVVLDAGDDKMAPDGPAALRNDGAHPGGPVDQDGHGTLHLRSRAAVRIPSNTGPRNPWSVPPYTCQLASTLTVGCPCFQSRIFVFLSPRCGMGHLLRTRSIIPQIETKSQTRYFQPPKEALLFQPGGPALNAVEEAAPGWA